MKEVISLTMVAGQAAENHGDEWGLTWHLQGGIHKSIQTWTHSQKFLATAEALKISTHATSLKTSPTELLVLGLTESQWELRQPHDQNFPMEEKPLQNKYQHQKK